MEIVVPVLILAAICAVAAVGFRIITKRGGSDADSTATVPNQEPRPERPLGDTPEAHDEITPHDLPLDNPGRERVERITRERDQQTTPSQGPAE